MKKKFEQTKVDITNTQKESKKYENEFRNLKAQKNRNLDMPGVEDYVKQKEQVADLKKEMKTWKKKIEIATIAAKEHEKMLRRKQHSQMRANAMNE